MSHAACAGFLFVWATRKDTREMFTNDVVANRRKRGKKHGKK